MTISHPKQSKFQKFQYTIEGEAAKTKQNQQL